jgi:glutamate-1-semialdehyde aminotransferase/acyl carrier protein
MPQGRIVGMLKTLLGRMVGINPDEVSVSATFPEMGADSLFLLEASHAIRNQFGVKVPFRMMLNEYSTIEALAAYIGGKLPAGSPAPDSEAAEETPPAAPGASEPAPAAVTAAEVRPRRPAPDDAAPSQAGPVEPPTAAVGQGSVVGQSGIERLLAQQLELMSRQLEVLRAGRAAKPLPAAIDAAQPPAFAPRPAPAPTAPAPRAEAPAPSALDKAYEPKPYVAYQPIRKDSGGLTERQRRHVDELVARLNARTKGSKRIAEESRRVLANNRASAGFRLPWKEMLYPLVAESASGARLRDVDGNEYVDLVMGFGALLFGHSPSFVTEAMREQVGRGIQLGAESNLTGRVAALLSELTGVERVNFCSSGTEAVMAALRLARAVTGRTKIAVFEGCYHGTFDGVMVRADKTASGGELRAVPLTLGTTPNTVEDVLMLRFDDFEGLEVLRRHAHELAAVLVEPLPSRRPDLQPAPFLRELRRLTSELGIALVFDEVVTGFRLHPGGAQALYGVRADLVTYGKAVGAGIPVGVMAGKAEYMDAIDGGAWNYGDDSYPQAETTFVAGTYFRHPLTMPVVWSVLNHVKDGGTEPYDRLRARASGLAATLNEFFEREGVPIRMRQVESLLRFVPHRDMNFMDIFYYHLLENGVYICETRSCFLSTAHTDEDIARVVEAVKRTVAAMREGDLLPRVGPGGDGDRPARKPGPRSLPLTEAQKAVWGLAQMNEAASRAYHESSTMDIAGPFDVAAVRRAIGELVARHEALRLTFSPEGDAQFVHPHVAVDVPLVDFSNLDDEAREAETKSWLTREVQRSFDLARGPLVRASVVKLAEQRHLLVLTIHHLVVDGWSNAILQQELAALYEAACSGVPAGLPPAPQFSEYVLAHADPEGAEFKRAESYWLEKFADSVPALNLPADKPRPAELTYAAHRQTMTFDAALLQDLKALAARHGATLFNTLLAGFNVLLHHLTRQDDLVVGIHSAGQLTTGGQDLVGHCVNLLPLRSRVAGDPTFAEYMAEVKRLLGEAYEHQHYSMPRLVKRLNLRRDPGRLPLVSVVFNLDKSPGGAQPSAARVGVSSNPPSFLQWELSLNVIELSDRLLVGCDHKTDLFDAPSVRRWMGYFETILRVAASRPEARLSEMAEALAASDRRELNAEEQQLDEARERKFKSVKRKAVQSA